MTTDESNTARALSEEPFEARTTYPNPTARTFHKGRKWVVEKVNSWWG